jgi:hypothetical protein
MIRDGRGHDLTPQHQRAHAAWLNGRTWQRVL